MTRRRAPQGGRRGDIRTTPTSPVEIGRLLRQARESVGLDLLTVHDRIGRPITQIEALEAGDLRQLPDQAGALSTLRRYAAFLSLDGDAMALHLMEAWSSAGAPTAFRPTVAPATVAVGAGAPVDSPDHLRAFTQTGQVPAVGAVFDTGMPTGIVTALEPEDLRVTRRAARRARRRSRAPRWLRTSTWVIALLVVVAGAGQYLVLTHPRLLADWHVLRVTGPGGAPIPVTRHVTHTTAPPPPLVHLASTTPAGATYTVGARNFAVTVAPSGGCWVQVSDPSSLTPVFQAVLAAGQRKTFQATSSLTVQVGSAAVAVGVSVGTKLGLQVAPKQAPFTYTFQSAPGAS